MKIYRKIIRDIRTDKLISAEWFDYRGPLALASAVFTPAQNAYRFYDDGSETDAPPIAAQDTAISRNVITNLIVHLRIRIQETGGKNGATTDDWQLQVKKNAGAFANVTTSSTNVQGFDSGFLTDAATTTQRLTNGTGSFVAGEIGETGIVVDRQLTASNYDEMLYSLLLIAADVANGDTLTFRTLINGATMTYNVTPTINVTKTTPAEIGMMASRGIIMFP